MCRLFARLALLGQKVAAREVELAQRLPAASGPVAALEPRIAPGIFERDGFAVTFWTYYAAMTAGQYSPAEHADTLRPLHEAMRKVDIKRRTSRHVTARVAAAERLLTSRHETPALSDGDRHLLLSTLHDARHHISSHGTTEQLLHGEPHPGNLLSTEEGLLFIDFEPCCRGPVQFDLGHVRRRSARTIRILITCCLKNVAGSFLRWSLPGAGTSAMISRTETNTAKTL